MVKVISMCGQLEMVVLQMMIATVTGIRPVSIPSQLVALVIMVCLPTTLNCVRPLWLSLSMVEHIENERKIRW